jgi:tRNA uridine 5-carboxymethylaminomethyl modification enzyme
MEAIFGAPGAFRGELPARSGLYRDPRQRCARSRETLIAAGLELDLSSTARLLDVASVETEFRYEGYLRRQIASVERLRRHEGRRIPDAFPFDRVPGLSREMVQRLSEIRPETLGQAGRIPGVTPAAVSVLSAFINRAQSLS